MLLSELPDGPAAELKGTSPNMDVSTLARAGGISTWLTPVAPFTVTKAAKKGGHNLSTDLAPFCHMSRRASLRLSGHARGRHAMNLLAKRRSVSTRFKRTAKLELGR